MKILHLRASNFYGGPERQLHKHALEISGGDNSIIIGSYMESGRIPEFIDIVAADGIATHVFEVESAYDFKSVGLLKNYLKENEIDLLCTHDYRSNIIGFFATRGIDTGWIGFSRGYTRESLRIIFYGILDRLVLRFADRVVAVSGAQKKRLKRALIPSKKIITVHNAIDTRDLTDIKAVDLRGRFGFGTGDFIFVAAGRFSPEKGHRYLVEAAKDAIGGNNRIRVLMFGDGPVMGNIQNRISELGLANKIICPGFEKNLIGCLKGADALVNPSESEGLPNIVLEAMAVRIPVLATWVGGVPELVTQGKDGYLVPPGDISALSRGMLELSADSGMRAEFIDNALKTVENRFTFDIQKRKLEKIYADSV